MAIARGGIRTTITSISEIATSIASAVDQQEASTTEIARNCQQAAQGTEEVSRNVEALQGASTETGSAASQMLGAVDNVVDQSNELRRQVETFLNEVRVA